MNMIKENNIFFVGIKGVALANLAIILKKMKKNVCGSDIDDEFITDRTLKDNQIRIFRNFDPADLPESTDLVVYTAANQSSNNPQVLEAKKRGIRILHGSQLLREIILSYKRAVAVCGCHGKTTTSALLAYSLIKLGKKPTYMVGTSSFAEFDGGDYGNNHEYIVVEGDEYGINPPTDKTPKLFFLPVKYVLATNIDFDHPDVYRSLEETEKIFTQFFNDKQLFLCADDKNLMNAVKKINPQRYQTYGFDKKADLQIKNWQPEADGSSFGLSYQGNDLGQFKTALFGEKMVSNAAGVVLVLLAFGIAADEIKTAISGFTGAKRRFELIYTDRNTWLLDDYAHHPTEIRATINAARARFTGKRIIVLFQPHTFSRTRLLLEDFSECLNLADFALIAPIFTSARENQKDFGISSLEIEKKARKLGKNNVFAVGSTGELMAKLKNIIKKGDVIFTMGAGDIYKLGDDIIKEISKLK